MRRILVAVLTGLAIGLAVVAAEAADCGGAQACACGNTVTSNYTMTANLGPCSGHGLIIGDNVAVNGGGYTLSGPGTGTDFAGVYFNATDSSSVTNITITGFRHNARFKNAVANRLGDCTLTNAKGNNVARAVQVSGTSHLNEIDACEIDGSEDEGIHLGPGTYDNVVTGNTFANVSDENIYLLTTTGNTIAGNTTVGGTNGAFMKGSDHNSFDHNTYDKPTRVQDSDDTCCGSH